jgi:hexosaminidase
MEIFPSGDIIPLPEKIEYLPGMHRFKKDTIIITDSANSWNATYLQKLLAPPTGFLFMMQEHSQNVSNRIQLCLDQSLIRLGQEGYLLEIQPDVVVIKAPRTQGVFYGIQTLRFILPVEIENRSLVVGMDWVIPCVHIEDKPRFQWRGFMLDDGRYFHGKETMQFTIDLMALQKLNVLHWHLTEDQGWRIEIKKYPKLTEVGSWRAGTSKTILGNKHDGIPHGGFYTQDDIREIVAYAAKRNITIVPEIEMPGHSLAALASYPDLACNPGTFNVATHFGIFSDIYCAGKEHVFTFLEDVIDEILNLFPSPYIHIGGDEAPKKRWKNCPLCQRRIKEQGLSGEHDLQVYFTNRIAAYIDSKGRRVMGWNEILQEGLVETAIVQYWRGGFIRLLRAIRNEKRSIVMSPYLQTYLDHSYSLMPLSLAYQYEPVPVKLDDSEAETILGVEFPLWSEWVPNRARLDFQVYPRLTAMAETGWTIKSRKDLKYFLHRMESFSKRLDLLNVGYASPKTAEPAKIKQWFGIFTIPQPQTQIADPGQVELRQ